MLSLSLSLSRERVRWNSAIRPDQKRRKRNLERVTRCASQRLSLSLMERVLWLSRVAWLDEREETKGSLRLCGVVFEKKTALRTRVEDTPKNHERSGKEKGRKDALLDAAESVLSRALDASSRRGHTRVCQLLLDAGPPPRVLLEARNVSNLPIWARSSTFKRVSGAGHARGFPSNTLDRSYTIERASYAASPTRSRTPPSNLKTLKNLLNLES